jgi:hypothetical protein
MPGPFGLPPAMTHDQMYDWLTCVEGRTHRAAPAVMSWARESAWAHPDNDRDLSAPGRILVYHGGGTYQVFRRG